MSSISGPSAPTFQSPLDLQGAGEPTSASTPAATPATPNPALYQTFGTSIFPSGALGLRAALNAEDAAIILAEAALAIDAATTNASNQRIANAASGRRAGPGQALSDMATASTALAANQASRAVEAGKLRTETARRNGLVEDAKSIQAEINGLKDQIGTASDEDKPGLQTRLTDAEQRLSGKNAEIAASDRTIDALNTKIDTLDAEIAANRTALEAAGLALLTAFSQIALQLQSEGSALTRDALASSGLDQRLDDLTDTLKAFRQDELARAETEAQASDAEQEAQVSRRVMQAALGLLSGLETVLDLLRQAEPAASVNGREAALASGQRFQLAL